MKTLIKILKGILIGISSITPGVSGSMVATSFNIYEELIDALNMFFKKPFKAIFLIWEYLIGVIVGILLGIIFISKLLIIIPLYIMFFFIGLIIGTIPDIFKEEKNSKFRWHHLLIIIVSMAAILLLLLIKPQNPQEIEGFMLYLTYGLIGFLIAVPMIIPGLSGATILMVLGLYTYFTNLVTNIINHLINLEFILFFKSSIPLIVIVVSAFVGLIIFAKLIKYLLKNHKTSFNMAILGLLLIAPINIIISINKETTNLFENLNFIKIFISIISLLLGIIIISYQNIIKARSINEEVKTEN